MKNLQLLGEGAYAEVTKFVVFTSTNFMSQLFLIFFFFFLTGGYGTEKKLQSNFFEKLSLALLPLFRISFFFFFSFSFSFFFSSPSSHPLSSHPLPPSRTQKNDKVMVVFNNFRREVALMSMLRNKHIVSLKGVVLAPRIAVVMEVRKETEGKGKEEGRKEEEKEKKGYWYWD